MTATPRKGTLCRWDDARGFGFIAPADGGPQLFVHASAFARDGTRPTVGERLSYELGRGRDGRPQALQVVRLAVGTPAPQRDAALSRPPPSPTPRPAVRSPRRAPRGGNGWAARIVLLVLLAAIGSYGWRQFTAAQGRAALAAPQAEPPAPGVHLRDTAAAAPADSSASFRCDGRLYCSQMTSCTEAKWFLQHCPGTRMDGNNDGVPCEQQWCTSPFAK